MLGSAELHHLAQWDTRPHSTLSLYLSLDQARDSRLSSLSQMIKAKEQYLKSQGSSLDWETIARDFARATRYVEELPLGPERGLALFSCLNQDLFMAYPLSSVVPNRVELGPQPYIRPLAVLAGDHCQSLIVLTDQRLTRFFEASLGKISELKDLELLSENPPTEKDGNQGRAGDKKLSRRAEEARLRHRKEVSQTIMDHFQDSGYRQLLIGGAKPSVDALNAELHTYLKERLAGSFTLDVGASLPEVSQAVEEAQAAACLQRQEALFDNLGKNLGPGGRAATGLNQVLASLFEGQVHTILVTRDFTAPGGSCSGCGRLRHVAGPCPICGQEMTPVEDVVNLAMVKAIDSGASLEEVQPPSPLDDLGSIAALLRYS